VNRIPDLSEFLEPIYEYEISRGNTVERVDRPAGSNCPLAVVFAMPLDVQGFISSLGLPSNAKTWENRDRHYPLEKGFVCEITHQAIAGPLRK
jgi:hypothetical protein